MFFRRKSVGPRPIHFVYAPQHRNAGSTVMRGQQLSEIAAEALDGRPVDFAPLSNDFRNADLFLTKGALKSVDAAGLRRLRKHRNRLFVDPVDEDLAEPLAQHADVIVAASRVAADAYRDRWPDKHVALINHHVDPRVTAALKRRTATTFTAAEIGYFGELVNTVQSPRIDEIVDFTLVDTSKQDERWFDMLPDYNMHYAVRQTRALDQFKPFLKGFTAAACGANVMIHRDGAEARRWLPADYPYWLTGDLTEDNIVSALSRARESFGSSEWRDGLDAMADIAAQTSRSAIGLELVSLFR